MHEIFLHKITLGLIPADHALEDSRFRDLITWISIKLLDLLIGRNYLVQTRSIALVSKFCTFVSLDALLFFYFWDTIPEDIFLNADMISSNFSLLKKKYLPIKIRCIWPGQFGWNHTGGLQSDGHRYLFGPVRLTILCALNL